MFMIISGGDVYAPEYLGKKDILIAGKKIAAIADKLDITGLGDIPKIDAAGKRVTPGIVDGHIHFVGAGGGAGPSSRNTLLHLSTLIKAGVTSAVGVLGIDKIGFQLKDLLLRCRALDIQGITTKMLVGSYTFPTATITGDVVSDLCLIEQVIGTKIAMYEVLSSHPNKDMLKKVIADTYLGGRIGGKAGLVVSHVGNVPGNMEEVSDLMDEMGMPQEKFLFTHVNRSEEKLQQAIACGKRGLSLDLSGNVVPKIGVIPASTAYRRMLEAGVPEKVITFSSDSNALHFGEEGTEILPVDICIREMKDMVQREGLTLTQALMPLTKVPAERYLMKEKGTLEVGKDADILLLDDALTVDTVLAKGRVMLKDHEPVVRGPIEAPLKKNLSP